MPAWLDRLLRRYRDVRLLAELGAIGRGRVEIEGRIESVDLLEDPIDGRACVAMDYRAWPPSTTLGMDGGTSYGSRAYQVNARQAAHFVLTDGQTRVLVQVDEGDDVVGLHRRLLAQFGVNLRAECDTVAVGATVRVAGLLTHTTPAGSPHRASPYQAVVRAERFWQPA